MSEQTLNLINKIVIDAEKNEVAKLKIENNTFDGKTILLNERKIISFGSYSYLGLEVDERLKNGAVDAIGRYGVQYPSSRIYSYVPLYDDLLNLFKKIFGTEVVLTTSLSLGHSGVLPVIIKREDILILDQHVHSSVQDAAEKLKAKGIHVSVVRHNDMADLERKIIHYSNRHSRIWYAVDGIYSMYGDTAPFKKLQGLMEKYSQFYVYADDAHGISSFGRNGSGWVLSQIPLSDQLFLSTGMAKAFGTMGGVFVTTNKEFFTKINNCTGSLIFSGPHPIPVLGASVKSAEIHLTEEIITLQNELRRKIHYCHDLLRTEGVPEISERDTPIFFVPVSQLEAGYLLVRKMKEDGFLTNLASFPAVSESCTGVRFTISRHHSLNDISGLVDALKKNYTKVLKEVGIDFETVKRAFRRVHTFPIDLTLEEVTMIEESRLRIDQFDSINSIPMNYRDQIIAINKVFSHEVLENFERFGEEAILPEEKYDLVYYVVTDTGGNLILATVFTVMLIKEDMLSSKEISRSVEDIRGFDSYYLSARKMVMGLPLSEGGHIFSNGSGSEKESALALVVQESEKYIERENINSVIFRDIALSDLTTQSILTNKGFLELESLDDHLIELTGDNPTQFLNSLNKKHRKYIRQNVFKKIQDYNSCLIEEPGEEEVSKFYQLYTNVLQRSTELNTYPVSEGLIRSLLDHEFYLLELTYREKIVAYMLIKENDKSLLPILIGYDHNYREQNVYAVMIWKVIDLAFQRGKQFIELGSTASQNKRKFGALKISGKFFIKSTDNLNQLLINSHSQGTRLEVKDVVF